MHAMISRALRAVDHAFSARREYMTKDGNIVYGGPDHYARLAAVKHFRDFMPAGRPTPKQPEKEARRGMTLPKCTAEGHAAEIQTLDVLRRSLRRRLLG